MMKLGSTCPNSDMGVVWELLCLHPNTIKPSYYYHYYYSSYSSRRELVRPNSQTLMMRSILNFTWRWIPISRGAFRSWNFPNGVIAMETVNICKNLWSLLYRKPPNGFLQDLAYILSNVGRIFWQKKITSEWPPFRKCPPTKSAKFQCSLNSMKIDI
jgi:hypothetical protein